jgi:hypothetical protein
MEKRLDADAKVSRFLLAVAAGPLVLALSKVGDVAEQGSLLVTGIYSLGLLSGLTASFLTGMLFLETCVQPTGVIKRTTSDDEYAEMLENALVSLSETRSRISTPLDWAISIEYSAFVLAALLYAWSAHA